MGGSLSVGASSSPFSIFQHALSKYDKLARPKAEASVKVLEFVSVKLATGKEYLTQGATPPDKVLEAEKDFPQQWAGCYAMSLPMVFSSKTPDPAKERELVRFPSFFFVEDKATLKLMGACQKKDTLTVMYRKYIEVEGTPNTTEGYMFSDATLCFPHFPMRNCQVFAIFFNRLDYQKDEIELDGKKKGKEEATHFVNCK